MSISRRRFVKGLLLPAALGALPAAAAAADAPPSIIDTNVHLFAWPFRKLKYGQTQALVAKLRKHRIATAWAGSFEALLHRDLDGVNARLAAECQAHGDGLLLPFGAVNPALPDWEEDLRRCHEKHRMRGVRLYPSYHNYTLQHPDVARLLKLASQRGLVVQVALRMEDPRVHLPVTRTPVVDIDPLPDLLAAAPGVKLQLLNTFISTQALEGAAGHRLVEQTRVAFDISHVEGQAGLGKLAAAPPAALPRLLFGSHAPYFPCESALFKLFESALDRPALEKIMRGNAEQLLKG